MGIRDKIRRNAEHLLQPGERIQSVIPAQTASQYWVLVSLFLLVILNSYRVIIVTDRRILVCRSGRLRMTPVNEVLRELPRTIWIGPPRGLWYRCDHLGEKLYINARFHKDVRLGDEIPTPGLRTQPQASF